MPYSIRGRVMAGAALLLLGSMGAPACGSSSSGPLPGAGGADDSNAAQCRRDSDCDDGQTCAAGACRNSCVSDKDCHATDQLCGDANVCVDCITDAHCNKDELCTPQGTCKSTSSGDAGAPSGGGSSSVGGDPGSPNAGAPNGGTQNQGDAGMPGNPEAGAGSIGGDCVTTPIDPCAVMPHFIGTQTVDGDGNEFCDIAPFTLSMATPNFYRAPKPPISSTTKATFRVGWSATALHVFVEVVDSAVHPNISASLTNIWNGDNIEFYASPKTPAGLFNATRTYESGAFQVIAAPPGLQPPAGQAAYTSTGYAYAVPAAQYKSTITATGYNFEAQIFWTDAAPVAGTKMGFDAGLSDDIDGVYNVNAEYRDYYTLLYNASYPGAGCSNYYEPYCDSRNWCVPTAQP